MGGGEEGRRKGVGEEEDREEGRREGVTKRGYCFGVCQTS